MNNKPTDIAKNGIIFVFADVFGLLSAFLADDAGAAEAAEVFLLLFKAISLWSIYSAEFARKSS